MSPEGTIIPGELTHQSNLEHLIQTMSMFYDNRVNQIREKRRVMNKIRQKLEEAETEDDIDFEAPSIYLTLKVAEIVMQNNECLVMKVI